MEEHLSRLFFLSKLFLVVGPYKYPREIEYVDELPKTISGKIRWVGLRETD